MFAKALIAGALAIVAAAQSTSLSFTNVPKAIVAGQNADLAFVASGSGPVTILLRKGNSNDLKTVATLTSSATSPYQWTPSSELVSGSDYALQIEQGSQINYYGPFTISGGSSSSTSSIGSALSSSASFASAPAYASSSASVTITATQHSTAVTTATLSLSSSTGVSVCGNTTLSRATFPAMATGSTNATGYRSSNTTSALAVQSTGGASALLTSGSSILALVFGGVAAVFFF